MKIGIFSGTFDPVHDGHLWLAKKALDLGLDKVVFVPETSPRRKSSVISLEKRVDMLKAVVGDNLGFEILATNEDSHTVDGVLDALQKHFNEDDVYTVILGADTFEHLPQWDGVQKLIEEVDFIVALRTEDDGELAVEVAEKLHIKPQMIVSEFPNLSSSKVRETIAKGEQVENVNGVVYDYIKANKLYGQ